MKDVLKTVDHTMLKPTSNINDIKKLCEEAKKMNVASVCVPPSYVKFCSDYLNGDIAVCTVIGFPLGYSTTSTKIFEAQDALENGATEIDMVVNIGDIKNKDYDKIYKEIKAIKLKIKENILKVIIETCYLDEEEKIKMCEIITKSGADYIKTSTGFGTSGATLSDVKLFKKHIGKDVKVKAAGGIKTIDDAKNFINEGVSRLGTSSICKIINNESVNGY